MSSPPPPPDPPDRLDTFLEELRATPPAPPEIAREVWHRIAREETEKQELRGRWLESLAQVFARPSFAVAFVAACGLLGLFLAETKIARSEAARGTQLARSYLMLIDPLIADDATVRFPATEVTR